MSQTKLPAFESIKSTFFPFMHDQIAGLHGWAALRCVNLLHNYSTYSSPSSQMKVVHVGAGFGGDMQIAYAQCIQNRVGLEKDPLQIKLAELLRVVSRDKLYELLSKDEVVKTLYPTGSILHVADTYVEKRAESYDPKSLDIRQCDVRDRSQLAQQLGNYHGMFNCMIGNIMMQWLIQGGYSLETALDILGEMLVEGGIAVFSVPFHFTELEDLGEDEELRKKCMPDTEFYRVFTETVIEKLEKVFGAVPREKFRKVPSLLMKEGDLKKGSSSMELVCHSREWCDRTSSIHLAMAGFGTYESALRTRQPAAKVAPYVAEALQRASWVVGSDETAGTFVTYYIYRRK